MCFNKQTAGRGHTNRLQCTHSNIQYHALISYPLIVAIQGLYDEKQWASIWEVEIYF